MTVMFKGDNFLQVYGKCVGIVYIYIYIYTSNITYKNVTKIDNTYIIPKINFDKFLHPANSHHATYSFREAVHKYTAILG